MTLELRDLQEPSTTVRRTLPGETFSQGGEAEYRVVGAATVDLLVRKDGVRYRLLGRLDATLELSCGRCLEPVSMAIATEIDLLYLPASDNGGDGEVQIEASDLTVAYYRDEQIELTQLVQEQFQLALPMKPLCRDDCLGLCVVCGGNRNAVMCECVETWEDPRLAVLKGLVN